MVRFKAFEEKSIIIKKDDPGNSMFVIIDGSAEVTSPAGEVIYATLSANAFFGEVSMFYNVMRTATVRARVQTTVLELSKESLMSALEEYPEFKETIMKKAQENFDLFNKRQSERNISQKLDRRDTEELEVATVIERLKKVCSYCLY
jgi:CRP-like cAMP-binding protein